MKNSYRNQQIMTSSSEELTLLLYNGAIRFISVSIAAMEKRDIQQSHNANLRAQDIVNEFMITLDMKYEMSKTWLQLYEYILYCLFQGNIRKDKEQLLQAKLLLSDLREAWVVAMKIVSPKQIKTGIVANKTKQLWLDYLFLTKEMIRFLREQDMDTFYELMNQRKRLQGMLDHMVDDEFRNSDEGEGLLFEIQSDSHFIAKMLQIKCNIGKRQHQTSSVYDNEIGASVSHRSWQR